ncbi:MAG TPA: nucleotide exchange factor GrpE [Vicinamibacterales bacterium]|jgi:molecular chaperone GrpE
MPQDREHQESPAGAATGPVEDAQAPQTEPAPALDVDALSRERDDYYDRLLRKTAEFDNYRKRTDRERRETVHLATGDVLEALLPIVDDFERALKTEAGPEAETYRQGVELIYKQLLDFLTRRGVTPIEAAGKPFDPRFHQAITYETSPGRDEGEVIEEVRRGYMHGERLLRPTMVKVAKA